ncbi:Flp pilus assembly protein TadG [Granulicella aggregans]|uniref:Flp pilus assembly protein TadG n=1 Tax=Granulicella aggregans TaxID=474949 RepID=A0A7W8E3Q3_9BACT|nr:TadE/TadG family type IV pilus assembly protein [Granulicella aggregans]MBB5057484.1 Flp pilus assembly protein TadG [Granulicella aggregans]
MNDTGCAENEDRVPDGLRRRLARFRVEDRASSLIECALLLPMVIVLLLGSVDFGRAFYVNLEVAAAAEAGALYGVQNPADTSGMQAAAILDAPDINLLSSTATYGTECSDGTMVTASNLPVPSCSVNAVTYVEVTTSMVYKPYFTYPGMGATWSLASKARLRTTQ